LTRRRRRNKINIKYIKNKREETMQETIKDPFQIQRLEKSQAVITPADKPLYRKK